MRFSLLLCTLNREYELRNCVNSLRNQTFDDYEIIIVDQSDSVSTEYFNLDKVKYKHITEKGLSNARNVGLKLVTGDVVCLVDDDAFYEPTWLESINTLHDKDNVDVWVGRVKDPYRDVYALSGNNNFPIKRLNFFNVMSYGLSAACIFRKEALVKIGFDDRFGVGSRWGAGEETDVLWTILELHGTIRYDPSIVVYHPIYDEEKISVKKLESYNFGFGALFAKHCFRDYRIFFFVLYSFLRNIFGMLLYLCLFNKKQFRIQNMKFVNKIRGFIDYLKYRK